MYYEIHSKTGKSILGRELLSPFSQLYEVMQIPTFYLTLPIKYNDYLDARSEITLHLNEKVYNGRLIEKSLDKNREYIDCYFEHLTGELGDRLTPINYNVKDKTLQQAMNDPALTNMNINKSYVNIGTTNIVDYTFSKISKIQVMDEICKMNEDVFWRINMNTSRSVEFFQIKDAPVKMVSIEKESFQNIQIIEETNINYDWSKVYNMATAYGNKSDTGNSSLTLNPTNFDSTPYLNPKFPIVAINNGIANNERLYKNYNTVRAGDNNNIEWAVVDLDGVDMENGIILEGNFTFNDIYPTPDNADTDNPSKEITEENIIEAWYELYKATIRKLKNARRRFELTFLCTEVNDIKVGDAVRLVYNNLTSEPKQCGDNISHYVSLDDIFYIQSIEIIIQQDGSELSQIVFTDNLYNVKEDLDV